MLKAEVPAKELATLLHNAYTIGNDKSMPKPLDLTKEMIEQLWPKPRHPGFIDGDAAIDAAGAEWVMSYGKWQLTKRPQQLPAEEDSPTGPVDIDTLTITNLAPRRRAQFNDYALAIRERALRVTMELPAVEAARGAARVRACPHVLLSYVPEKGLFCYGFSRHAAGRTHMELEAGGEEVSVTLSVEDAKVLASGLNKIPGGQKAMAVLAMENGGTPVALSVREYNPEKEEHPLLYAGADSDNGECDQWFDMVDDLVLTEEPSVETPIVLGADSLTRLSKLKVDSMDLAVTATAHPHINCVRMGRSFIGLIGAVNRDLQVIQAESSQAA